MFLGSKTRKSFLGLGLLLVLFSSQLSLANNAQILTIENTQLTEQELNFNSSTCENTETGCYPPPPPPTTNVPTPDKNRIRSRLEPILQIYFDYGQYIVNLTQQPKRPEPLPPFTNPYSIESEKINVTFGNYEKGFQKTVYGMLEFGLGAQLKFWFEKATGWQPSFWAYVGLYPIKGIATESTRFVSSLEKAYAMGGRFRVPSQASDLEQWDSADSITYLSRGGLAFSAGAGVGPAGVSTTRLAQGLWETYIEKVGATKVYVKITCGRLDSLSALGMAGIVVVGKSYFKYADDGFSYVFDISTELGRKAYEDLIRGNIFSSDRIALEKPKNLVEAVPVQKVETFRNVSSGSVVSSVFYIPILWNKAYSKGHVHSFTTSDLQFEKSTTRVHYGIFSESEDSRFWRAHKAKSSMFYGAKYSVDNWENQTHMSSMFGVFSYANRHESSSGERLLGGINDLIQKTGLEVLRLNVPNAPDLGYAGVEFQVKFNEENTLRILSSVDHLERKTFIENSLDHLQNYFDSKKTIFANCNMDQIQSSEIKTQSECLQAIEIQTSEMLGKIYDSIKRMKMTAETDYRAFSAAYAEFGEAMSANPLTFKLAMDMAGAGATIDYLVEGTMISMFFQRWKTETDGSWIPVNGAENGHRPFDPQVRHSKARGVFVGNIPGDIYYPNLIAVPSIFEN